MSPLFVFTSLWFMVILLQNAHMMNFYSDINTGFILTLLATLAISYFFVFMIDKFYLKRRYLNRAILDQRSKKYTLYKIIFFNKRLKKILILIFLFESFVSGGFPLFWIISGSGYTHVDFGIPTLHGFFHGILLYFVTSSFLGFMKGISRKENLKNMAFFLFYAAIVFNRGIVVLFLLQALFIFLVLQNKVKMKHFIVGGLFIVPIVIWLFGLLGDIRSGGNVFLISISPEWSGFFEIFPENLAWFYVYATGALNNVYFNIDNIEPVGYPMYTFAKLIPTALYDLLGIEKMYDSFTLADGRITVSTAFQGLISDFGVLGILAYVPILIYSHVQYRKAMFGDTYSILYYSMFIQSIVMTSYIDTIFYLTFALQLFIVWVVKNYKIKAFSSHEK